MAKRNAEVVLQYSTAYPFRLQGNSMLCVYCCESYQDPAEYRQHMDSTHQNFTVSTAFAHCSRRKDYLKVDLTGLKCRLCAETYSNVKDMAKHIYDLHECKKLNLNYEVGMQPYKMEKGCWECSICDMRLPSLVKLGRHTTAHYQKFTCDICGRNYYTNESLKYHVRLSHSGKHSCRKCWVEFSNLDEKKEHLKVSKQCWSFCCLTCGDRFMSWENKQKHQVQVHGCAKRTYECPDCDKVFDSRKHFYKHYKLSHTDENFICSCCGLKFANKRELDDHRIGHTGEKGHKCSVCVSKRFPGRNH
jgi:KRAB domain-containing zinc finger protein